MVILIYSRYSGLFCGETALIRQSYQWKDMVADTNLLDVKQQLKELIQQRAYKKNSIFKTPSGVVSTFFDFLKISPKHKGIQPAGEVVFNEIKDLDIHAVNHLLLKEKPYLHPSRAPDYLIKSAAVIAGSRPLIVRAAFFGNCAVVKEKHMFLRPDGFSMADNKNH
jgi:hypothetical protein